MSKQIEPPFYIALCTYLSFTLLYVVGNIWDFVEVNVLRLTPPCDKPGYAPIRVQREDFYTRRVFNRIGDVFNRPIASAPDNHIDVMERTHPYTADQKLKVTGRCQRCVNIGSYNYLGFAAADPFCTPLVLDALKHHNPSMCSPRMEAGTCTVHQELEEELAQFLGKEASMVYGMGYATNSANIPALAGPGCLIISDSLNHSSIVAGTRGSGAKVIRFRHNDTVHLEALLRECIAEGQPRTHRPWKKVLIVVEGIYSMEGEVCQLKEIVEIKKKYKAYLYVDEAHSIGALGVTGRGVTEHCGVDPKDVDVLMGTFTKSFGSCGGYLAGDAELIQYLRLHSPAHLYATSMAPAAVKQVTAALRLMRGEDGTDRGARKISQLHSNSNYMRKQLEEMGVEVLGDSNSPVMPIMVYCPCKVAAFSRLAFQRGVAAVVVGFPATPLLLARARVCISAAHTKEDLDYTLKVIREISELICLQADTSVATMFTSLLSWLTLPSITSLLAAQETTCLPEPHAPRTPAAAPASKQRTGQLQSPSQQQKKPQQQQNGTRLRRAAQRSGPTARVVQALATGPVTRSSAAARA